MDVVGWLVHAAETQTGGALSTPAHAARAPVTEPQPNPAPLPPTQFMATFVKTPRHASLPEHYGGDPDTCRSFLLACDLYFEEYPEMTSLQKVSLLTHRKGIRVAYSSLDARGRPCTSIFGV